MTHYILDSLGNRVASFRNYLDALNAKNILYQRPDWSILSIQPEFRKSTPRQKSAIEFCQEMDFPEFTGNLDNFYDCSSYLSKYLEQAKSMYQELSGEYKAYVQELD